MAVQQVNICLDPAVQHFHYLSTSYLFFIFLLRSENIENVNYLS